MYVCNMRTKDIINKNRKRQCTVEVYITNDQYRIANLGAFQVHRIFLRMCILKLLQTPA
jgi:hypothetical protein